MSSPTILVSTWVSGLYRVTDAAVHQELLDQSVHSLTADGQGGVLAVVGRDSIYRRSSGGEWTAIAESRAELSCCMPVGNTILVGTEEARLIRFDADGSAHDVTGFDATEGRSTWYAGGMMIDGEFKGPPLGIRSMAATCNGAVFFVNVHVGGIPRSTDGGSTWHPTVDIDDDVHQVCTHPTRPELVIAASSVGLCISRDAGATWTIENQGLHALHCTAVAFGRNDLFISAATDHFSDQGTVYRRRIDGTGPLERLNVDIPEWLDGIVDTDCIATRDSMVAVIDRAGSLHVSVDDGTTWQCRCRGLAGGSGLAIC